MVLVAVLREPLAPALGELVTVVWAVDPVVSEQQRCHRVGGIVTEKLLKEAPQLAWQAGGVVTEESLKEEAQHGYWQVRALARMVMVMLMVQGVATVALVWLGVAPVVSAL